MLGWISYPNTTPSTLNDNLVKHVSYSPTYVIEYKLTVFTLFEHNILKISFYVWS